MTYPRFEFDMVLATDPTQWQLQEGILTIKRDGKNAGVKLRVTSGLAGYQTKGAWRVKGRGCIPPSLQISPHNWSVSTLKLWMPDVRGVEGSFYAISPFSVKMPGVTRGDFGIHFDPVHGTPGSAGCIVLRDQGHWDLFRAEIGQFRLDGIQSIPLFVTYA